MTAYTLTSQLPENGEFDHMDIAMYYYEDGDEEKWHPLKEDLRAGGVVLEFDVMERWRDDHCDCLSIRVKTAKDEYVIAHWWVDALDTYKAYNDAVNSVEGSKELFDSYFKEYGEE